MMFLPMRDSPQAAPENVHKSYTVRLLAVVSCNVTAMAPCDESTGQLFCRVTPASECCGRGVLH